MPTELLFLSHAAADQELVEAFRNLLEGGIGVPADAIFCTSLPGQDLDFGDKFKEEIHARLEQATVVIGLLTPAWLRSSFCLAELGATWAWGKTFVPFLLNPLGFKDLAAVAEGLHAGKLEDEEALDSLHDQLQKRFSVNTKTYGLVRWKKARAEYVRRQASFIADSKKKPPPVVAYEELQKTKAALAQVEDEATSLSNQLSECEERVKKVLAAGTAEEKRIAARRPVPDQDRFDSLVGGVRQLFDNSGMPRIAKIAMYYANKGETYFLDDDSPPTDDAVDRLWIDLNDNRVELHSHRRATYSPIETALRELDHFLREEASVEFCEAYEQKYDVPPDLTNRDFWSVHFGPPF